MKWLAILAVTIGWSPTTFGVPTQIALPVALAIWGCCKWDLHERWKHAERVLEWERNMAWLEGPMWRTRVRYLRDRAAKQK